jgi:hypothetical protein
VIQKVDGQYVLNSSCLSRCVQETSYKGKCFLGSLGKHNNVLVAEMQASAIAKFVLKKARSHTHTHTYTPTHTHTHTPTHTHTHVETFEN